MAFKILSGPLAILRAAKPWPWPPPIRLLMTPLSLSFLVATSEKQMSEGRSAINHSLVIIVKVHLNTIDMSHFQILRKSASDLVKKCGSSQLC